MNSFSDLGLSDAIVATVSRLGYENPTPVQAQAIPVLLQGNTDLVCLSQTGTGKTAAFGLPIIQLADDYSKQTQALIVAPTRELCLQIKNDLANYAKGDKHLNVTAVYGGASIQEQIRQLKKGAQIICATPGRLMDLMDRGAVDISDVKFVVLDEADEMLNMGFKEDIDFILSHTPKHKNVWLFSATMPPEVAAISKNYMSAPFEISVGTKNSTNTNIEHQFMLVEDRNKYAALKRVLDFNTEIFGVVFCRTKMETQEIAEKLINDGYNADSLHGDLSQGQRDKVMRAFKNKTLQLLIATDVAARGIDVNNVTHVIHLNIPDEIEYYTHRSGRTARAGRTGVSLAIIAKRDRSKLKQIEKKTGVTFAQALIPTGEQVCQKRLLELIHRLHEVKIADAEIEPLLPNIYKEFEDLSKEEIIKRFTSLEFNRYFDYYRGAQDLNARPDGAPRSKEDGGGGSSNGDMIPMFINIGKMEGLDTGKLYSFLVQRGNVNKKAIGNIKVKGAYSFFEMEEEFAYQLRQSLHGFDYKGRRIRIEIEGEGEGDNSTRSSGGTRTSGGGGSRNSGGGGSYNKGPRKTGGYEGGGNRGGSGGGGYDKKKKRY